MLLSICIPTYNRLKYLQELLAMLLPQVEILPDGIVEVIVSDNKSTDGTTDFCKTLRAAFLRTWTNSENIGAERNYFRCINEAQGEYIWLLGDDDILPARAVERVVSFLQSHHPKLLISADIDGVDGAIYEDYSAVLSKMTDDFVLAHTLISANVFRRDSFDMAFAESKLWTQYVHLFGFMQGLPGGHIGILPRFIKVRPIRPNFAKFPSCLCVKQAVYLCYLAHKFGQPRLYWKAFLNACNLPIEYLSRIKNWLFKKT